MRKRLLAEDGFTLAEMMVTITVMIVVLFALHSIFDMSLRVFSFGNDKVEAVENARLGLEKMEREIRAAYPVDKTATPPKTHLFFSAGASSTPALPEQRRMTFGNDLPSGATSSNRKVDAEEEITYELRSGSDLNDSCPTTGTDGVCALVRRKGPVATAALEPVVEYVVPNGLTFEYLHSDLTPDTSTDGVTDGTDIGVVRVTLQVEVGDGRTQTLTTDVDLRNQGE